MRAEGIDEMPFAVRDASAPLLARRASLDQRINHSFEQLRRARLDGNYAEICYFISEVNALLDRWREQQAPGRTAHPTR